MSEFFINPRAAEDYRHALSWYAERSRTTAKAFETAVEAAIADIADAPTRWPVFDERSRYRLVDGFPYLIVYRIRAGSIVVVAVAHGSRQVFWRDR